MTHATTVQESCTKTVRRKKRQDEFVELARVAEATTEVYEKHRSLYNAAGEVLARKIGLSKDKKVHVTAKNFSVNGKDYLDSMERWFFDFLFFLNREWKQKKYLAEFDSEFFESVKACVTGELYSKILNSCMEYMYATGQVKVK